MHNSNLKPLALILFLITGYHLFAGWTDDVAIGQTSRMAPALAFYNKQLQLVHPSNSRSDDTLYWSVYDNNKWSNNVSFAKERSRGAGPALATTPNQMVLFFRGENSEGRLYMSTYSDVQWTAGQRIENVNGVEGLAATGSVDSDNLYVVFRKTDNTVWYTTATGTGAVWNTPNQIEGVSALSAPALTMMSTTLHMAYAGTDGKIYDCVQGTDGRWTSTAIPGAKGDNVGSTTVGGVLYLVFTGESGKYLWFTSYQATGWTKPVPIKDHDATYSPALAGDSSTNTLYMVHVGKGGSKLYFSQYTP